MSHCEVALSNELLTHIEELKKGNVGSYIIYRIENSIVVKEDFTGIAPNPKTIADHLPKDDCRFVVYNYKTGTDGHEPLLITW